MAASAPRSPPTMPGPGRLRARVFVSLAALFAAFLGSSLAAVWYRYDQAIQTAHRRADNLDLILTEHFRRSVDAVDATLTQLARQGQRLGAGPAPADAWAPVLTPALSGLPGVGSISVTDAAGTITASTSSIIVGQSQSDFLLFRYLSSTPQGGLAADTPFKSLRDGRMLIPLGRRLHSPDGTFVGIVVATLVPDQLRGFYQSVNVGPNGVISVLHPTGLILFREPSSSDPIGQPVEDSALLRAQHSTPAHGILDAPLQAGGRGYISAYRSLNEPPVIVAVSLAKSDMLAAWRGEAVIVGLVTAGTGLALLLAAFLIAREIRARNAADLRLTDAHATLQASERRFQAIMDHAPVLVTVKDRDGRYTFVNRAFEQRVGKTGTELLGKTSGEALMSDRALLHAAHEQEVMITGAPIQSEVTGPDPVHPRSLLVVQFPLLDAAGSVESVGSIATDMTESKRAQEALRDNEQWASGIVADALDAIIQMNELGEVVEWNPQAETIFGWSRQEAVGRPITALYLPKGYTPRYLAMNERLQRGEKIDGERFEFEALRKDGKRIKAEVSMTGVRRRGGNLFNLFLRDITQKLAAEEQLRQSQKMEAIGQVTGGIAHDFNNMLTVITGTIDILAEGVVDQPALAAIAKLIGEAADRGAELTGHLLAFSRKQPLQPRETDINALIWNAAKLLRPLLGEHVEIDPMLEPDTWPSLIDPTQLTSALLNLAVNARDAMPHGGKLTLQAKNVVLDETYARSNSEVRPGSYVVIAVSDSGTGIPEAIRDKVFEPFFSTKEVGKGTGLGLSMVYGFVKQSGGHIKIYSEEGLGTTIKMYLPRAGAQAAQSGEPLTVPLAEHGTETILLVEDDPTVRTSVTTLVESLGYRTIAAANAAEALAIVDGGAAFGLLFTDVIMSGPMNGRQLADEIAKRRPGIKVLFTSGYTEHTIVHHGRLDPDVLLLTKPYRKHDLARMLRTALGTAAVSQWDKEI
jgi:PAS domain S-box-containing protein